MYSYRSLFALILRFWYHASCLYQRHDEADDNCLCGWLMVFCLVFVVFLLTWWWLLCFVLFCVCLVTCAQNMPCKPASVKVSFCQYVCVSYVMRARRHGQGVLTLLWKCCKAFLCITVTAKRSIDELFIHYFHRLSSVSGSFALRRPPGLHFWTPLRDFCPQTPNLPTLGKNPAGARGVCARLSAQNLEIDLTQYGIIMSYDLS